MGTEKNMFDTLKDKAASLADDLVAQCADNGAMDAVAGNPARWSPATSRETVPSAAELKAEMAKMWPSKAPTKAQIWALPCAKALHAAVAWEDASLAITFGSLNPVVGAEAWVPSDIFCSSSLVAGSRGPGRHDLRVGPSFATHCGFGCLRRQMRSRPCGQG